MKPQVVLPNDSAELMHIKHINLGFRIDGWQGESLSHYAPDYVPPLDYGSEPRSGEGGDERWKE